MIYARSLIACADAQPAELLGAATRKRLGTGIIVQAAQFFMGKRARDILSRVCDGELTCDEGLTPLALLDAALLAEKLVNLLGQPKTTYE